jgi:hypothetical protein
MNGDTIIFYLIIYIPGISSIQVKIKTGLMGSILMPGGSFIEGQTCLFDEN